jgi:hypothetical protein
MQQFPTLRCRCEHKHEWESLIPNYWFAIKDIECPECSGPVVSMKAGSFLGADQLRQQMGEKPNIPG